MPQLSELQRDQPRHVSARNPESHAVGEETYVIDERSRSSMSSVVEAKLVRLNEVAIRFLSRLRTNDN